MSTRAELLARPLAARLGLNNGRLAFATFAFFVAFGANGLKNAFGWWVWGALVLAVFGGCLAWLIRDGEIRRLHRLPAPLLAFAALATASIAWSQWRPSTLLAVLVLGLTALCGVALARMLDWHGLVVALGAALRGVLALSFLFELWVSLVVRHPVLPVWISGDPETAPLQYLWSRDLLLVTGKIQGIVGNSAILAHIALLSLVTTGVQFAIGRIGRVAAPFWLLLALGTIVLTRSATVTIALVVATAATVALLVRRRLESFRARLGFWAGIVAAAVIAAVVAVWQWSGILGILGKSGDLTGRTEIWAHTVALAVQRPWFGWGWLGYWPPWVTQLQINYRNGVQQLHAHDAWVDLFMQLGVVGIAVFAVLVLQTLHRAYRFTVDPVVGPGVGPGAGAGTGPGAGPDATTGSTGTGRDATAGPAAETDATGRRFADVAFLPMLLLVVALVDTVTESGILHQEGLLLFTVLVVALSVRPRR
ncbi:MAG: O-antigen ligase family protein [Microbacteriaceae bacterium]